MNRRMRTYFYAVFGAIGGLIGWQMSDFLGLSFITNLYLSEAVVGALIGFVGVIAGIAMGLITNLSLMQVGMDYSQFAGITDYMALISGRIYPTLGVSRLLMRASIIFVIAALAALVPAIIASRREPSEALHHV